MKSEWVEKVWQSKYLDEVDSKQTVVLPLLGEKCNIPILLKTKKYANFLKSFDVGLSELLQTIKPNCSVTIKACINSLIEGIDSKTCAEKLGKIAIRSSDESAAWGLWITIQQTENVVYIADHCAYHVGRIMVETTDPKMEKIAFEILNKSIESKCEIIVDKFAYTVGDILLQTKDSALRMLMIDFVEQNAESENELIKDKYIYTRERVNELNATILN